MSRLSGLALAAAALAVALFAAAPSFAATPVTPADRAAGMAAAPALIAAAHLPCTLVDARTAGNGTTGDNVKATFYEVACKDSLGYVLIKKDKVDVPQAFDCLILSTPGPDGKTSNLACQLPANLKPALGLQGPLTQLGRSCAVANGRYLGSTPDQHNLYEVACQDGTGLVLDMPSGGPAIASNCLNYTSGTVKCVLTTPAQEMAAVDSLAAASGKCAVANKRYVLGAEDGSDYFEIACTDGKGYMLHADKSGKLVEAISCAEAAQIGDGCTLTDARQAETQQNAVYSDLARKAGFDCQVSKYALFPNSDASKDIVELACANRPDGGVGVFPVHGAPFVYDCLRSQDEGFKCSFTPVEAVYPLLTNQLRAKGRTSCTVSGARPFAKTDDGSDFVEVACSDGNPGWVMVYPSQTRAPSELRSCGEVANTAGGCQLPTNRKRG
jgi:hypothetical protein